VNTPIAAVVNFLPPEPFVSAEEALKFVPITRRHLLTLARKGIAGAYPADPTTKRKVWLFRLSELIAAIARNRDPDPDDLRYDQGQPSVLVTERR
jgi:hypothetical protein